MSGFGTDATMEARVWRMMGRQAERQLRLARAMGEAMIRLHPARLCLSMLAAAADAGAERRGPAPARPAAANDAGAPKTRARSRATPAAGRAAPSAGRAAPAAATASGRKGARRRPAAPPAMPGSRVVPGGADA